MNPKATTPEAICAACRAIVQEKGLASISIRSAAKAAGVAPTTIYTFFPDKEALLLAVTASIWQEIFDHDELDEEELGFAGYVEALFVLARKGLSCYPGFLSGHALGFPSDVEALSEGWMQMHAFLASLEQHLLAALERDPAVRPDAFSSDLTQEGFCRLVLDQLLFQLVSGQESCKVLLTVIGRAIS